MFVFKGAAYPILSIRWDDYGDVVVCRMPNGRPSACRLNLGQLVCPD